MFVVDFLIAFGVALLLTAIFASAFRSTGPWSGFWAFFLVILLVSWAAGLWVAPFGPALWGVSWAPYLLFGLIAAFIIAAATPPRRPEERPSGSPEERARERRAHAERAPDLPSERDDDIAVEGAAVALGVFFWILLVLLLTVVAIGYF